MQLETPSGGQTVSQAAATAITPDPATAELLEKKAAGAALSPSEHGKLGAFAKKVKAIFVAKNGGTAVAASADNQTSADSLGNSEINADLVKRTTASVLKSADTIARRFIVREARKAGADDPTARRLDSAASLPAATQDLITDISPELLASLGVDPRSYPLTVAAASLAMWGTQLYLCVDELKTMQADKLKAEAAKQADVKEVKDAK